jgi:hypothetical protein
VVDERLLQPRQLPVLGEPLDADDVGAVVGDRQRQAAVDPLPVEQDRAGSALAVVTALLDPGQVEMLAQEVEHSRCSG